MSNPDLLESDDQKSPKRLQFRVSTLLWMMIAVATFFGGVQWEKIRSAPEPLSTKNANWSPPVGISPKNLKAAENDFEIAYEIASGEPPPPSATAQAMSMFSSSFQGLPRSLGTRAGNEARRLAILSKPLSELNGSEYIVKLKESRVTSLAGGISKELPGRLTKLDAPKHQMDGSLLVKDPSLITQLKANTEIQFPAGSWSIDVQTLERELQKANLTFHDSVSFTGQGKSKTTVTISNAGFTSRDVNNLCFRDMTIDCVNDAMFDKRQGSLTLRLDNVRLVRFDAGHGGCRLLRVNDGIIVHATDTDFVGGFGRSPGNGSIFASCDVLLGHFENCTFRGINYDLFRSIRSRQSQIWMDNCKFDRIYQPNPCVVLKDCDSDVVFAPANWAPKGE